MSQSTYRTRRIIAAVITTIGILLYGGVSYIDEYKAVSDYNQAAPSQPVSTTSALTALESLEVKGRAPKTGYTRSMFGNDWAQHGDCTTRELILARDLKDTRVTSECKVSQGVLYDPYTNSRIDFTRGPTTSDDVQIDHVVALSDAWQKGAQQLSQEAREEFANDPLELLAVEGAANQKKADGDAATWLPPNKLYRCEYVARQIAVKQKHSLWVTVAEKEAMQRVLERCPTQQLPG